MTQNIRKVIVTGANKGIGYGIVDNLASKGNWQVIMACRNPQLAQQSLRKIQQKYPNNKVSIGQLNVADEASISNFVKKMQSQHGQIDVLINNAGISIRNNPLTVEAVRETLATNYVGTVKLTQKMLPILKVKGKIISLGSSLGKYRVLTSSSLMDRWRNAQNEQQLQDLITEAESKVSQSGEKFTQLGYPSAYILSKVALNNYMTKILPHNPIVRAKQIQVYSQCPGYVNTDMTEGKGFLPVQKGILTTLYLLNLPFELNQQLQGGFFERSKISSL